MLYKVCINTALTRKKKQSKFGIADSIDEEDNTFVAEVDTYESKDLLEAAMALLNDTDKAFLVLYLEGYSYEEIAEMMGVSINNTGVKLNRIKNRLKNLLVQN